MLERLANTIKKITCEISCKDFGSKDAYTTTTLVILEMVSSYFWDAKVALAIAALVVYYGEFWLDVQLYTTNSLAKSIAVLKQMPDMVDKVDFLKPKYEAIANGITVMTEIIGCIVEFKKLPVQYISPDATVYERANATILEASYLIIKNIVVYMFQIRSLKSMGNESVSSTTEDRKLSSLDDKLYFVHFSLRHRLYECNRHIEKMKHEEAYQILKQTFKTPQHDNVKILNSLIPGEGDQLPLVEGSSNKRVSTDVLRGKLVLLLISDLDISVDELTILKGIYNESRKVPQTESQYEIVWLTVPWNEEKQQQFENYQKLVPWYTLYHPSSLQPAVTQYIKEVWHFDKKPKLVALDGEGSVVNPNAIDMMWIWGNRAFPFTEAQEKALWFKEKWGLELLVGPIDPLISKSIEVGNFNCLYGGTDMEWIQKFTTTARAVAEEAGVTLLMRYYGNSNPKEKVQMIINKINNQKLSNVLQDMAQIWFFWLRLKSMWHSIQQRKSTEQDSIMQEILTMMSFGESDQEWAVISLGSDMARARGDVMLACLNEFNEWKAYIPVKGFLQALNDYLKKLQTPHRCNRLLIPGTSGSIPDKVVCIECGRALEKFISFKCSV